MPRVHHVVSARKDNKAAGVKKGDSYYWWANRMPGSKSGVKRYSKTAPKAWQTKPPGSFAATVGELQQRIEDLSVEDGADDIKSTIEAVAEEARSLSEEQDEKFNNMPDGLQQGDTGQLLEERRDGLSSWADELEGIEVDEEDLQEAIDAAQGTDPGV